MEFSMLFGPLIGAVIGYCTNYIAVKMLFRPLRPVKIGNFTLPFTPGIIPKGQNRLAKALGQAVGTTLLTQKDFEETLMSEQMLSHLDQIAEKLYETQEDEMNLKDYCLLVTEEEGYQDGKGKLVNTVTDKIMDGACRIDFTEIIADKGVTAVKEHLDGFLAMMITDDMIRSFAQPLGDSIEKYVAEEGPALVWPIVYDEVTKFEQKTPGETLISLGVKKDTVKKAVRTIYCDFIRTKLADIIEKINISAMVEKKINDMEVEDIEILVMSIMKKELGAVVNLGAVIGFVIGLLNLFL
ncbi:MAG: DUF445 family protein [Lachnospiraceae bacterium]|nr:DUF445 family protein [Lachnospiraceae bacterium]